MSQPSPSAPERSGATVVITHRVLPGRHDEYEEWLTEIGAACRGSVGFLDHQIIRPIQDLSATYTVVIGFDTAEHVRAWVESEERRVLIEKAKPFLQTDNAYAIHSGLDFWFMPTGVRAQEPVRWKQFLVIWSAIYPLSFGVPLLVVPALAQLGIVNRAIVTLPVTAIMVGLMVYVVMPRYTKLVRKWLFT